MTNLTKRNGLVLSNEPSLNAHIFIFLFFSSVWICFMFLFCSVLFLFSFNFPSWYQFNFVSFNCWKFNFTYFSHNYDNYSMFRNVPGCSMFLVLLTPVTILGTKNTDAMLSSFPFLTRLWMTKIEAPSTLCATRSTGCLINPPKPNMRTIPCC